MASGKRFPKTTIGLRHAPFFDCPIEILGCAKAHEWWYQRDPWPCPRACNSHSGGSRSSVIHHTERARFPESGQALAFSTSILQNCSSANTNNRKALTRECSLTRKD